jgi:prophage regulatory protein
MEMAMQVQHSPSLRPRQAAEFLGIGVSTLWRWTKERAADGFPQPIKLGERTTVFEQSKLAGWREAQASK